MTDAAHLLGRPGNNRILQASLALVDHALDYGFDQGNGGLYLEGPAEGSANNKRKEWWQQAEALVAFLNAFQMTGNPKYYEAFEKQARFVEDNFVDREYGEWYTSISEDGKIQSEKAAVSELWEMGSVEVGDRRFSGIEKGRLGARAYF